LETGVSFNLRRERTEMTHCYSKYELYMILPCGGQ